MDRVAAKVAQKVFMLLENNNFDSGPGEQKAKHHSSRSTARDAAAGFGCNCRHQLDLNTGDQASGCGRNRIVRLSPGLGAKQAGTPTVRLVYHAPAFSSLPLVQESLSVMKHTKHILLMAFVVFALLVIGCSKAEETTNRSPATSAPPAASPAATTTTASTAGETGVPDCDAFLKAYEACIHDKVPANIRASFEPGIATWKKSWHDLAANPQTKATLAGVCKTARENANTSMKSYGCTF
jgi:hypothetical protein